MDDDIRQRIQQDLDAAYARLREHKRTPCEDVRPTNGADSEDPEAGVLEVREMSFATRSLLVERVNKLADALERLRTGDYGMCEECGEEIAPARLRALPEVVTCVRCQEALERLGAAAGRTGPASKSKEEDE